MNKTLTKADVVDYLHESVGINKTEAKELVENFFDEILISLSKGESVKLAGFGNFDILHKKERIGRNPKTGKEAIISQRKVVSFRAGKKLKNYLQEVDV
ncbi:MAG: integration host factor subunit alpha [SAR86 cluster bacterium]|jgi:integration host factor subunit alpha|nr:integration host factor subunit alpha [SAR86 cluster bacterium]|tara:strand:+ start:972 stop:1268 length:297 start_codon:yes stop_codon:yes gene_type:complete